MRRLGKVQVWKVSFAIFQVRAYSSRVSILIFHTRSSQQHKVKITTCGQPLTKRRRSFLFTSVTSESVVSKIRQSSRNIAKRKQWNYWVRLLVNWPMRWYIWNCDIPLITRNKTLQMHQLRCVANLCWKKTARCSRIFNLELLFRSIVFWDCRRYTIDSAIGTASYFSKSIGCSSHGLWTYQLLLAWPRVALRRANANGEYYCDGYL